MTDLIPLKDIESKELVYLWSDRIALGCVTVIEGDAGANKTTLTHELTARVTTGRPMPDCTTSLPSGNVIILQAEDDPAATIRPNLEAMAANLEKVFVIGKETEPLSFPEGVAVLAAHIGRLKAKLLIIDPITSFLAGSINSEHVVRRSLAPLVTVAETHGIAVVLIRHFTKSNGGNPLHRGCGSIAVTGLARSVLQVGTDPKDPEKRVIVQAKSNLNAPATSLSFKPVKKNGGLTVEWLGECDCTVDQLHATATKQDRPALEYAQYVLFSILAEGPVLANEAQKLGKATPD